MRDTVPVVTIHLLAPSVQHEETSQRYNINFFGGLCVAGDVISTYMMQLCARSRQLV